MTIALTSAHTIDAGHQSLETLIGKDYAARMMNPDYVYCFFPRYTSPKVSYGVHTLNYQDRGYRKELGRNFFVMANPIGLFSEQAIARWIYELEAQQIADHVVHFSLRELMDMNPVYSRVIVSSSLLPIEFKNDPPEFLLDHLQVIGRGEAVAQELAKWSF